MHILVKKKMQISAIKCRFRRPFPDSRDFSFFRFRLLFFLFWQPTLTLTLNRLDRFFQQSVLSSSSLHSTPTGQVWVGSKTDLAQLVDRPKLSNNNFIWATTNIFSLLFLAIRLLRFKFFSLLFW